MSASSSSLLTADQVAERWQVPKGYVYRLAREGIIPTVSLGRYYRFQLEAITAFERGGGTRAPRAA
jgi:excisionase family DNA binding protein